MSVAPAAAGLLQGRLARALSLALALSVTSFVIALPRFFATAMDEVPHAPLVVLMLGMSMAYVHGVGYLPRRRWLRPLASPLAAWMLVGIAAVLLAMR
jgi:cyd operon protein YbgE